MTSDSGRNFLRNLKDVRLLTAASKRIICVFLMLLLIIGAASFDMPVSARDEEDPLTLDKHLHTSMHLKFADDSKIENIEEIHYPFLDTATVAFEWSFPYSDDLFRQPSSEFSVLHAQAALGLAGSAFRSTTGVVSPQYETYLGGAGFGNLKAFGYDKPTTENSLSGVIGMKQIDDFTLIAAVTCGQGYQNEWAGNFENGTGVRHEGFEKAAKTLEGEIDEFIKTNNIEGKVKLWLGGISRAGAIANVAAADYIESKRFDDVYAYLYGVPRTTKEPLNYPGIYNICGEYDPVAATPLQSWGYERYGMDLYTPSQETTANYPELAKKASDVSRELDGKPYRNNPEVNYQFRLIMEWMAEFFTDGDDYYDRLAPLLEDAVARHNSQHMIDVLSTAVIKLKPKDEEEAESAKVLLDYLSFMVGEHLRADQRQIVDGSWDPDEPLAANLVIEHRVSTYAKWVFADAEPSELFKAVDATRRLTVVGQARVTVYNHGVGISSIDSRGKVTAPDETVDEHHSGYWGVFMMRNGSETVVCMPNSQEYQVVIEPDRYGTISYYGLVSSQSDLLTAMSDMYVQTLRPGKFFLNVSPGADLSYLVKEDGKVVKEGIGKYQYSPTLVMAAELDATRFTHMSLSNAYRFISAVIAGLNLLGLICIIIYFVHRRERKKKGHGPYSDWYVIVPHLIFIFAFAVLTQFASYFLFSINMARAQFAALTVLFIGLLALRGAIRSRRWVSYAIAVLLLGSAYFTGLYFNNLPIDSFSQLNAIIFFTIVALLSAVAIWCFKRKTPPENLEGETPSTQDRKSEDRE